MKFNLLNKAIIISGIAVDIGFCVVSFLILSWNYFFPDDSWQVATSPLNFEVVQNLCKTFELDEKGPCNKSQLVYAHDFYVPIKIYFIDHRPSIEEVDNLIGIYEVKQEIVPSGSNDLTYSRYWYDLRGDGTYFITVLFDEDGNFLRIEDVFIDEW